ncbi:MAG: tRNA (adenosine(37)-N6)-dimethylallyltransferase MiaA [Bdellovibrionales bacterium]
MSPVHPFVLIVGPTASGKSALALRIAKAYGGAILNCDSLQAYQRLDIGTAKPSPEERARVPHFLFDVRAPGEALTAGDFRRLALDVLARELPRHRVFGVGGSGFYIQALEKGMFEVEKPDPAVERQVRVDADTFGLEHLYRELERLDPEHAENVSPNDAYRIQRALVILRGSGRKVSALKRGLQANAFPYPLIKMGLMPTREQLLPRVRERAEWMLARGLIQEVQSLLDEGWESWPPLHSVGYKECIQYLKGEVPEDRLLPLITERTMQLAKKQRTWFKRDSGVQWLDVDHPFERARQLMDG